VTPLADCSRLGSMTEILDSLHESAFNMVRSERAVVGGRAEADCLTDGRPWFRLYHRACRENSSSNWRSTSCRRHRPSARRGRNTRVLLAQRQAPRVPLRHQARQAKPAPAAAARRANPPRPTSGRSHPRLPQALHGSTNSNSNSMPHLRLRLLLRRRRRRRLRHQRTTRQSRSSQWMPSRKSGRGCSRIRS